MNATMSINEQQVPSPDLSVLAAFRAARSGTAQNYSLQLTVSRLRGMLPLAAPAIVLDLGCGWRNLIFGDWLSSAQTWIGIDRRAEDVRRNQKIHLALVGDVEKSPLSDSSVDMIVSSFVIEHVNDPLAVLRECRRILKPGGAAVFCTPNLYGYKTLVGKFVGQTLSNLIWRIFKRQPHHPWPDLYRANTPVKVRDLCRESDLVLERLTYIPELPHFFYDIPLLLALARAWDRGLEIVRLPMLHNCIAYTLRRSEKSGDGSSQQLTARTAVS